MDRVVSRSVTGPRRDPLRSLGYQRKQEGIESRSPYRCPTSIRQAETEPAAGEAAISVGKVSFAILLFLKMLEDIRVSH